MYRSVTVFPNSTCGSRKQMIFTHLLILTQLLKMRKFDTEVNITLRNNEIQLQSDVVIRRRSIKRKRDRYKSIYVYVYSLIFSDKRITYAVS